MKSYSAEYQPWPKKVFQQFYQQDGIIFLESFRFNHFAWELLWGDQNFRIASQYLGDQVSLWTPLNVSLLIFLLQENLLTETNFHDKKWVLETLEHCSNSLPHRLNTTARPLEVAYQLRAQLAKTEINEVFSFLSVYNNEDICEDTDQWIHIFSILGNILAAPEKLYLEILKNNPSNEAVEFVCSAILSQPISTEAKGEAFSHLLSQLGISIRLGVLQFLAFRGAKAVVCQLAGCLLDTEDFKDIPVCRISKLPESEKPAFLQRVEYFLTLLFLTGNKGKFGQWVERFRAYLLEYGIAYERNGKIGLFSLPLSNADVQEILKDPDSKRWESLLLSPRTRSSAVMRKMFEAVHFLPTQNAENDHSFELKINPTDEISWNCYFTDVAQILLNYIADPESQDQILKLYLTGLCDYGIPAAADISFYPKFQETTHKVYWSWLTAIINPSNQTVKAKILRHYALLMDWGGVVETAVWIQKTTDLTTEGLNLFAQAYFKLGDIGEAINTAKVLLERDPTHFQANRILGLCYSQMDRHREAIDYLGQSVEYDAGNGTVWLVLAKSHCELNRVDLAMTTLQKGLLALPDNCELSYELSRLFWQSGQADAALDCLSNCENYLFSSLNRFSYLLDLLWDLEKFSDLQELAFTIGEKYLTSEKVVNYRAALYRMNDQDQHAIEELSNLVMQQRVQEQTFDILFSLIDGEKILTSFAIEPELKTIRIDIGKLVDIAVESYPENLKYQLFWCEVQIMRRKHHVAYEKLQQLSQNNMLVTPETRTRIEFNIGLCARFLREFDIALATFEALYRLHPNNKYVLMQLAEAYLANQLFPQAEKMTDKVVNLFSNDDTVLDWSIKMMSSTKEYEEIQVILQELTDLHPSSIAIKKSLIRIALQQSQTELAKKYLVEVVSSSLSLGEKDRVDLIHFALQNHAYEEAFQLFDEGGCGIHLPYLVLVNYLAGLMGAHRYQEAINAIEDAFEEYPGNRLLKVIQSDCYFYQTEYDAAKEILGELLGNTKKLASSVLSSILQKDFTQSEFQAEELFFTQSPISVYLRLALIERIQGNLTQFRSYTEKALAFDVNNPMSQYIFTLAVRMGGKPDESAKLQKLFIHWQETLQDNYLEDDHFEIFRKYLYADTLIQSANNGLNPPIARMEVTGRSCVKLSYAIRMIDQDSEISDDDFSQFLSSRDAELQTTHQFFIHKGFTAIFEVFFHDDHWYMQPGVFSNRLLQNWPKVDQYYHLLASESYAQVKYCEAGFGLLYLDRFYDELGISKHQFPQGLQLSAVAEEIQSILASQANNSVFQMLHPLMDWYQAICENRTILLSSVEMKILSPTLAVYYILASRLTNTTISLKEFEEFLRHPNIEILVQIALSYMSQNQTQEAWRIIKQALGRAPEDAIVRYVYAKVAYALGEKQAVVDGLQAALQIWPEEYSWHRWRAELLIEESKYEDAVVHLEELNNHGICTNEELVSLTRGLIEKKQFKKADIIIQRISAIEPGSYQSTALSCLLALKTRKGEIAAGLFAELSCIDELTLSVYLAMAHYKLAQQENDLALKLAKTAYEFMPSNTEVILVLAKSLIACHYFNDAEKLLHQLSEHKNVAIQFGRLKLLQLILGDDDYQSAVQAVHQYFPKEPDICFLLAKIYAAQGQISDALNLLAIVLQKEKISAEHHFFSGFLHNQAGNLDKAVNHLSLALQENSRDPDTLLLLASVYLKRRESREALKVYQKGIQYHPKDYRFYYECGRILREMKKYEDAEYMLRKASNIVPSRKDIRNQLGAIMALNFVHSI